MPESFFNKVIGFYPAISLKERTPIHVFSDEFARCLRHLFTEHLQATASVLWKKYFTNKIVKKSLRRKKWKQLVRKTKTRETKTYSLFTSSLHILSLFKNFLISLVSASYDILKTQLETMPSH